MRPDKRASYQRERRKQKLRNGICYDCSEPAMKEHTRCRKHYEKQKQSEIKMGNKPFDELWNSLTAIKV